MTNSRYDLIEVEKNPTYVHVALCSRGLTNLVELDLSGNALTRVPRFLPGDCKYLMRLSLRGNPGLSRLRRSDLAHLPDLNSLDLGECGLEEVEEGALAEADKLEYLRLEGNRLRTINPKLTFPHSLR